MLKKLGKIIVNGFKLCRSILFLGVIFVGVIFILGIFMPDNFQKTLEIFKNLF